MFLYLLFSSIVKPKQIYVRKSYSYFYWLRPLYPKESAHNIRGFCIEITVNVECFIIRFKIYFLKDDFTELFNSMNILVCEKKIKSVREFLATWYTVLQFQKSFLIKQVPLYGFSLILISKKHCDSTACTVWL